MKLTNCSYHRCAELAHFATVVIIVIIIMAASGSAPNAYNKRTQDISLLVFTGFTGRLWFIV